MPSARWKRNQIENARAWILKHPTASVAETMQATGVSQNSVGRLRKELLAAGLIQRYPHTPGANPDAPPPEPRAPAYVRADPLSTREVIDEAEAEKLLSGDVPFMTREQRRMKLEALVQHGGPDHIIRANSEIERMEKRDGQVEEIGPVPPQTLDDAIDETTDIVEALMAWGGEEAVKTAVTRGMERHITSERERAKIHYQSAPDLSGATT